MHDSCGAVADKEKQFKGLLYWAVLNAQLAVECRAQHVQDLLVGLARH